MIIDLHTHSHYSSDGKLTIPELLDYYSPGDIVGLTDHETIGGWDEFTTEAKKRGIRPILGVEWFAGEHHILSYFLKGVPDDFLSYMVERRSKERSCMLTVYTNLKKKYTALPPYEKIIKAKPHPEKILSVSALANEISIVSNVRFKDVVQNIRNIRRTLPEDQQQEIFYANEIIEKINSWGAVSILAHPYYENGSELTNNDVGKKLRTFKQYGIQGVEAISGRINEKMEKYILSLCDELALLPSIGSDFHYLGKGLEPKNLKCINEQLLVRVKEMVTEFKLNDFAAFEPITDDKNIERIEREQTKKDISNCTTKIMNTASFRKLAGKTQVILSLTGPDVRTRLTHTIEVAKIAKDICIRLGLNSDLAEAISLAHDIGHTPFGHVGERTLNEIMCGCDTLEKKVRDYDFANSGFKHNIQSFRVLNDIECVHKNGNQNEIWPFIFWGAPAHTRLTWAKADSGMDDEILISPKYCDRVYVCHHDDRKKCKRNIQIKKEKKNETEEKEICKPWYCANLPIIEDENNVNKDHLHNGETTKEYIKREPIEEDYVGPIRCSHKCYLAKLWKYKIHKKAGHKTYPYLFDHPFPNSFYIDSFHDYFKRNSDFISFEALIVGQADEIAQRQQDLEDGILKGLLSFKQAKEDVRKLVEVFLKNSGKEKLKKLIEKIIGVEKLNGLDEKYTFETLFDYISTSEELGKFLTVFYIDVIVAQTQQNVNKWATKKEKINISKYSLMNILYTMIDLPDKKTEWIIAELLSCKEDKNKSNIQKAKWLTTYFNLKIDKAYSEEAYLYLLSFDHLEQLTKRFDFEQQEQKKSMVKILSECVNCIENTKAETSNKVKELQEKLINRFKEIDPNDKNNFNFAFRFINALDSLRDFLRARYEEESRDFLDAENKYWKTIGWLNLYSFYPLLTIYEQIINWEKFIVIEDLKDFDIDVDGHRSKYELKTIFDNWKKILKADANKVLNNLVVFFDENDEAQEDALGKFEKDQCNTILKSEAVEKNDGKASYILKRLFKAYIDNSHQLSDSGLKSILTSLINEEIFKRLISDEEKTFDYILKELKETIISQTDKVGDILKTDYFKKILKEKENDTLEKNENLELLKDLKKNCSNEVKASLDKRKKLYNYFNKIQRDCSDIDKKFNSEDVEGKELIQSALRDLRAILDNPILNAIPYWQSILTRAICDYIANLTDQEAVNEYEKLYSGIMELA